MLLPALLLGGLIALLGVQTGIWQALRSTNPALAPAVTTIPAHAYSYRSAGDFLRDGVPVDGPLVTETAPHTLDIMTYPVSAADYARCVAATACLAAEPRRRSKGNVPVTGVSFDDATAYATWLSAQTGEAWRLPTVAEWTFAAGSKASDTALARDTNAANPAERWLALYEKEAALGANALAAPQPLGGFGTNEFGVADLAGTVWEWTATCGGRTSLDARGHHDRPPRLLRRPWQLRRRLHPRTAADLLHLLYALLADAVLRHPARLGFRLVRDLLGTGLPSSSEFLVPMSSASPTPCKRRQSPPKKPAHHRPGIDITYSSMSWASGYAAQPLGQAQAPARPPDRARIPLSGPVSATPISSSIRPGASAMALPAMPGTSSPSPSASPPRSTPRPGCAPAPLPR